MKNQKRVERQEFVEFLARYPKAFEQTFQAVHEGNRYAMANYLINRGRGQEIVARLEVSDRDGIRYWIKG